MGTDKQPTETPHKTQPVKIRERIPRGALWGFFLLAALYVLQGFLSIQLERTRQQGVKALEADRFRAQLITLATGANTVEERLDRLQFLLDLGLLEDKGGQIKKAVDAKKVPKLPPSGFFSAGALPGEDEGGPGNTLTQPTEKTPKRRP